MKRVDSLLKQTLRFSLIGIINRKLYVIEATDNSRLSLC